MNHFQRIVLTSGEPAGIGPDLCIQLVQQALDCEVIVIADPDLIVQRAKQLKLPVRIKPFVETDSPEAGQAGVMKLLSLELPVAAESGSLNQQNSQYVLSMIELATRGCLEDKFSAMVTAPVHKAVINDAGFSFSGHTEFIAELTGGKPVMMLATPGLRVALATTHLPLNQVSAALTVSTLTSVLDVLNQDLSSRMGISHPHILVCGLNPHAGENGHLGREEIEVIEPVLSRLRQQNMNLTGPLPADTLFTEHRLKQADAVLAMYHDQGLPVLKYKGFGRAVNITLGLPIIRTSVDHGTALDLAGCGQADTGSLIYAVETAVEMSQHKP